MIFTFNSSYFSFVLTSRYFSRKNLFRKKQKQAAKDRTGHFKGATQGIGVVLTVAS